MRLQKHSHCQSRKRQHCQTEKLNCNSRPIQLTKLSQYQRNDFAQSKRKIGNRSLDNPNLVCHIQGIIVWSQPNIRLLSSIRPASQDGEILVSVYLRHYVEQMYFKKLRRQSEFLIKKKLITRAPIMFFVVNPD